MRHATWIAVALLATAVTAAQAGGDKPYLGKKKLAEPPKKAIGAGTPAPSARTPALPGIRQGGEDFGSAVVIPSLPYADAGNTCNNIDDYYPSCAFAGFSFAPDVVYSYTPTTTQCVTFSMCASSYDTILHVYAGDPSNLIACNDDDPDGTCFLQSVLRDVTLTGGVTYYIVVDGYADACGEYVLELEQCTLCTVDCPPGSVPEGEPDCGPNYEDTTNGGCNSNPYVFTDLTCDDLGLTVCGTMGTYDFFGDSFRDTDWYQVTVTQPTMLTMCVNAEAPPLVAIIDGNLGCPVTDPSILCFQFGQRCVQTCCQANVLPGIYWLFVAPQTFTGVPCGTRYTMSVEGYDCPPVGVQPAAWGKVKGLYR